MESIAGRFAAASGRARRTCRRFSKQGLWLDVFRVADHCSDCVCGGILASDLRNHLLNRLVFWALLIAQLGLVFYLSARVDKVAPTTAAGLFILYSTLTGITSSVILLLYTGASITSTFIITAGMFGATAVFGTVTKRSLAGMGQFLFMGLIGLILAMIVGMFWQSGALQFVISVVGVLVFTGLTAWDAQRLKQMAVSLPDGRVGAYAVVGALSLYLDFINLFFFLLRFTGGMA